jgi:hypothetical protein
MEFNKSGHLKELYHLKSIAELNRDFVKPFENSISRELIFKDYIEYTTLLKLSFLTKSFNGLTGVL